MNETDIDFERSLEMAEVSCYAVLCERLGFVPARNAFVSVRGENAVDCMVFDIGHLQNGESMAYDATQLHFRATVEIYNRKREEVQRGIMRMVSAFPIGSMHNQGHPIREDSNVLEFRIAMEQGAIGDVKTQEVEVRTGGNKVPVFVATVMFDVVFSTGARGQN